MLYSIRIIIYCRNNLTWYKIDLFSCLDHGMPPSLPLCAATLTIYLSLWWSGQHTNLLSKYCWIRLIYFSCYQGLIGYLTINLLHLDFKYQITCLTNQWIIIYLFQRPNIAWILTMRTKELMLLLHCHSAQFVTTGSKIQ